MRSKSPVGDISVVALIRTSTTLDHSQKAEKVSIGGWMDYGWMGGWVDGWMRGWVAGWLAGWLAGRKEGRMDGWMDGWMDGPV